MLLLVQTHLNLCVLNYVGVRNQQSGRFGWLQLLLWAWLLPRPLLQLLLIRLVLLLAMLLFLLLLPPIPALLKPCLLLCIQLPTPVKRLQSFEKLLHNHPTWRVCCYYAVQQVYRDKQQHAMHCQTAQQVLT
jgi:hypothetical protein